MVSSRKQSRARGRTERGHMKSVVTKSLGGELVERRRSNGPAKRGRIAESCIVNQHEKNVRRVRRSFHWMSKSRFRSFQRTFRDPLEQLGPTRQHRSVPVPIRSETFKHLRYDCTCRHNQTQL